MKIAFTWDDGAIEDKILFDLHNKYKIPGMFFVPTSNSEGRAVLSSEDISDAAKSDLISFGGHTQHHTYLTKISVNDVEKEILGNKRYLEDILGKPALDFCLPGGQYNFEILELVLKHFKTVRTADTMCFKRYRPRVVKPTFHFYPRGYKSMVLNALRNGSMKPVCDLLLNPGRNYFDSIRHFLDAYKNDDVEIVIWGHSWEIDELNLWKELENTMEFISKELLSKCYSYRAFCNLM